MWLLVGLGNPGRRYAGNRHNVGFMVLDELARSHGVSNFRVRMGAEIAEAELRGQRTLFCKPQEYMNLSGQAVARAAGFWKIPPEKILVVHDDMDLAYERVRLVHGGGTGGHNGLKSLVAELGTQAFPRVRFGIGRPPAAWDPADFVLADFSKEEMRSLPNLVEEAAQAVEVALEKGMVTAMNRFNKRKKTEEGP